jgi:hypothetical protein
MSDKKHGWHPITKEDIKLGVMVRISGLDDTFNTATIISTTGMLDKRYLSFKIARPYAYANAEWSSNQPMLGCEVIDYSLDRAGVLLSVWHGRDGVRTMAHKAA